MIFLTNNHLTPRKGLYMNKHLRNFIPFVIISLLYMSVVFIFALQFDRPLEHLCLVKNITGIPCPGCGLTRSFLSLLSGHLSKAFFYHPLFFTIPFILIIIIFLNVGFEPMYRKLYERLLYGMIFLFFLTYGIRMYLYFPNRSPMNFNVDAWIPKIVHIIQTITN